MKLVQSAHYNRGLRPHYAVLLSWLINILNPCAVFVHNVAYIYQCHYLHDNIGNRLLHGTAIDATVQVLLAAGNSDA